MKGEVKAFLLRRLLAFGMVVSFIFIAIVSLVASAVLAYFLDTHTGSSFLRLVSFAANMLVFSVIFAAIFKILPDRNIDLKNSFICGIITALFFIVGKSLIGFYLGRTAVGSVYGGAGALVVLLVWFYYSSFVVFIGAEISSVFFLGKKEQV